MVLLFLAYKLINDKVKKEKAKKVTLLASTSTSTSPDILTTSSSTSKSTPNPASAISETEQALKIAQLEEQFKFLTSAFNATSPKIPVSTKAYPYSPADIGDDDALKREKKEDEEKETGVFEMEAEAVRPIVPPPYQAKGTIVVPERTNEHEEKAVTENETAICELEAAVRFELA